MPATDDAKLLAGRFGERVLDTAEFRGESTVTVEKSALREMLAVCRDELGYAMLLDVTGIDHMGRAPRFEVVYELAALLNEKHLRLKIRLEDGEEAPSVWQLWGGAEWHEREVWDMMGIPFSEHPDLRRILMWEGYPYHPLRKEFPLAGIPTEMPDLPFSDSAPMEGGPFVTCEAADVEGREPRARPMD